MRASLVSVVLMAAAIISILFINAGPNQILKKSMISSLSGSLVKSPMIVFLTNRVNASNARIDQETERERKRQLEIQAAIKKRDERKARQFQQQNEGT